MSSTIQLFYHKKVILLPKQVWKIWDFNFLTGSNPVEKWRKELSDDAREMFDGILQDLSKTANHLNWTSFKRFLKGYDGIWELQFYADHRQYRVLGEFSGEKQATLLLGCYHKGKIYTPADALDAASDRKQLLKLGKATRSERKIRFDI
jgi:hypothetical protein